MELIPLGVFNIFMFLYLSAPLVAV